MKKRRSYDNVGRPTKDFEDQSEEGKRVAARSILDHMKTSAKTDSPMAIYKAAKLKADDEDHKDAAFVLSKIYEDPIENGAKIRSAMEVVGNEGKLTIK